MPVHFESQAEPIAGYRLLDRLGSGGFGEVWRAEAPGGIFKAIKLIHGDLRARESDSYRFAEQELKSLNRVKQVRHPYLLALDRIDVVDGRLMIVMELADCNLWDRFRQCRKAGLPGIPRDELLRYMSETAEVLDLMNDRFQLQHLDIKPQNLFLLHQHVKVADFGQVKDLEGIVASVTGGITPVYAAPETFDGYVSRFCDQYSLACVYQELLTGVRPFDGTSMQQLLMQHLQLPPDLAPSPPADRPALARALAKKPEGRFPTVTAMVDAIRAGAAPVVRVAAPPPAPEPVATPAVAELLELLAVADNTPAPRPAADTLPPAAERAAPPEVTGPGPIRPALILAVGYTGLRVAQRLRRQLADRFGPPDATPAVRCVYLDTAPDAADLAAAAAGDGLAPLRPEEVVTARLNRAAHYHKPQLSGRSIMDEWFDPQLLYKLHRVPLTQGLRPFGRLAFCDHFRAIGQRLAVELDACLDRHALADTQTGTGLPLGSNRPRVYVVAGLGGGTGGGMFLDLAYLVRRRLAQIGYADPDVVGVLLMPPDGPPGSVAPQAQANTYAALTELHHFSRPETAFAAFDDRGGRTAPDAAPPFRAVYLLPGLPHPPVPPTGSGVIATAGPRSVAGRGPSATVPTSATIRGSGVFTASRGDARPAVAGPDPTAAAADLIRLDLFTPVGRSAEAGRPTPPDPTAIRTAGLCRFTWPRGAVVRRVARVLAPALLHHWTHPDPALVRQAIPKWAVEQWGRLGLDPDALLGRLAAEVAGEIGGTVEAAVAAVTDPLHPRTWRAKAPDPRAASLAVDKLIALLGRPQVMASQAVSRVEEALAAAADAARPEVVDDLAACFHGLVETQTYRVAGAEEAARQVLALFEQARGWCKQEARAAQERAAAALAQVLELAHGARAGRHTPAEFAAALAAFPHAQFRYLLCLAAGRLYTHARDAVAAQAAELAGFRQRLEACRTELAVLAERPAAPAAPGDLLPLDTNSPEEAAQFFLRTLTDDDLIALDGRVQGGLARTFGGLYEACLNTADGLDGLTAVLREEARGYLNERLGEVDVAGMMARRFGPGRGVGDGLVWGHQAAAPPLVAGGPWAKAEVTVFGCPAGAGGDPVRRQAVGVLSAATADTADEVVIYREWPAVPLAALAQLGPAWAAAYRDAPTASQATPHARADITRWVGVDAD